tara:strand:- start:394 stop:759 length:366 start_codon:yes stop_codon:yes gene_type:complete
MHEEDEERMVAFSWIVAGTSNMELHGYCDKDEPKEPTIQVLMSGNGAWSFKFKKLSGSGRIQVTKGCDYNPLDLIESLYHHITKQTPESTETNKNRKPKATIDCDPNRSFDNVIDFRDDWQ